MCDVFHTKQVLIFWFMNSPPLLDFSVLIVQENLVLSMEMKYLNTTIDLSLEFIKQT